MIELRVQPEHARSRLDRYLALALPDFSRSRLQTLIRDGCVRVNGKIPKPKDSIRTDDLIELEEPAVEKIEAQPEAIPLEVLFEDDDLLVLNKAAGIVVHPGAGNLEHTLVNALLHHSAELSAIGGKERPGIVHRLDKETSGCLVVAKNDLAHRDLAKQFAARTTEKIYLALVAGILKKKSGVIDAAIGRHPIDRKKMTIAKARGRSAKTEYASLGHDASKSVVVCTLHSGRTHQIRVHLHHLGHPVLGDKLYGAKSTPQFARQMLHAWKLGFHHPRSAERLAFEAPLPDDFLKAAEGIEFGSQETRKQP